MTVEVFVRIEWMRLPQLVQPKVRDLEDEARVYQAIRRLEIPVAAYLRGVQVSHAPHDVVDERAPEHAVQLHLLVLQDVLKTGKARISPFTVTRCNENNCGGDGGGTTVRKSERERRHEMTFLRVEGLFPATLRSSARISFSGDFAVFVGITRESTILIHLQNKQKYLSVQPYKSRWFNVLHARSLAFCQNGFYIQYFCESFIGCSV